MKFILSHSQLRQLKIKSLFFLNPLLAADNAVTPSDILKFANVDVLDNPTCQERLPSFEDWVKATHICSNNEKAQVCNVCIF